MVEDPTNTDSNTNPEAAAERLADARLEELLELPENAFLTEHSQHYSAIEEAWARSAVEALQIAEQLITLRLETTYKVHLSPAIEGVTVGEVSFETARKAIESIKRNQQEIGRGGDAVVVIDKSEIEELPPEVCYKLATEEKTARGRNSIKQEADVHADFYKASLELEEYGVGVPEPFYAIEMGADKLISMEKLPARSIEDIKNKLGSLPEWFDVEVFCDHLEIFVEELNKRGLYHRDIHVGNIMIRQTPEEPEDGKWGYLIDFGLSGHGQENMDPYKKVVAGTTFTYNKDDVIVQSLRNTLRSLRRQQEV